MRMVADNQINRTKVEQPKVVESVVVQPNVALQQASNMAVSINKRIIMETERLEALANMKVENEKKELEKTAEAEAIAKAKLIEKLNEQFENAVWTDIKSEESNFDKVKKLTEIDETIYPYLESFPNIKSMSFADNFNATINLSKITSLSEVTFGTYFNQVISKDTLPSSLTKLSLGLNYIRKIESLPAKLEHLTFGNRFNTSIVLPSTLKSVTFGDAFNQDIVLPFGLEELTFGYHFNKMLVLPNSLKVLHLSTKFNNDLSLNEGLEELTIGVQFNKSLKTPSSLKTLRLKNRNILSKISVSKSVQVIM